jgi:hypothetical protein
MPYISGNQTSNRAKKAVKFVDPNANTKLNATTNIFASRELDEFTYINLLTGAKEVITPKMLPNLIKEYIDYVLKEAPTYPGEFFDLEKRIPVMTINNLRKDFPLLEQAWQQVRAIIRAKREQRLIQDPIYLRNTHAMYAEDVNAFEERRLNMRNKLDSMEHDLAEIKAYIDAVAVTKVEETEEVRLLREKHAGMLTESKSK